MPSVEDIVSAIPPTGITVNGLVARFKQRVPKPMMPDFIKLVKTVSYFDKTKNNLIFRKK
jgi:hypothetical protein